MMCRHGLLLALAISMIGCQAAISGESLSTPPRADRGSLTRFLKARPLDRLPFRRDLFAQHEYYSTVMVWQVADDTPESSHPGHQLRLYGYGGSVDVAVGKELIRLGRNDKILVPKNAPYRIINRSIVGRSVVLGVFDPRYNGTDASQPKRAAEQQSIVSDQEKEYGSLPAPDRGRRPRGRYLQF